MGLTPQHQRRCTSRLRTQPPAARAGANALAPVAAGCGGTAAGRFARGAVANSGGYSNSTNDSLINQALTSNNMQAMYSWQDFLSAQLPLIWAPQADRQVNEMANNLRGAYPLSPTLSINPENWYFVK